MPRDLIPLHVEDLSAFSRALSHQLKEAAEPPSHLALMNMLARATGFRNFQHLKAAHQANERLTTESPPPAATDHSLVERALNQFDSSGKLMQWPSRRAVQELCLWALWARLPAGAGLSERAMTDLLDRQHLFGDAALLRRELFDFRLVTRNKDGSDYRRTEKAPTPEARALIRHLTARG
ncbi:MAG TPA: DUF2087 domain-containing protein [Hyphomonas sp.]|nr:DUF2087 domain-containing protein [Hyphomonas sp.]HRX73646.1 DUF2087 domain-containing protein [Hyphomonas sp.]